MVSSHSRAAALAAAVASQQAAACQRTRMNGGERMLREQREVSVVCVCVCVSKLRLTWSVLPVAVVHLLMVFWSLCLCFSGHPHSGSFSISCLIRSPSTQAQHPRRHAHGRLPRKPLRFPRSTCLHRQPLPPPVLLVHHHRYAQRMQSQEPVALHQGFIPTSNNNNSCCHLSLLPSDGSVSWLLLPPPLSAIKLHRLCRLNRHRFT